MPIDPSKVQWDAPDPGQVQWDDAPKAPPTAKADRFAKGLRDSIDGGAQLLTKALPEPVVSAGNRLNNWLADKTGLVARLPEGGVDQQVREAEAAYQQRRAAAGESGIDWMRLGGNVLSPANLAIASRIPQATTLAGRVGLGALGGAQSALWQPATSTEDSFGTEKMKQAATGAAFGGAVPTLGAGLQRLISPNASTNPANAALREAGVRLTIGQTLGGAANRLEEKAMSVPFVGDVIRTARERGTTDLNRAVANRALQPIGQALPEGVVGREAVAHVQRQLSSAYDDLLPRMTVRLDSAFGSDLQNVRNMVNTGALDPNAGRLFERIVNSDVVSKMAGRRAVTGQTFKAIEGDLGAQISRLSQSTDADQRLVADALREVQDSLRQLAVRANPALADELGRINAGYAVFKRMERAASGLGTEEGAFTAAQLQNAVKALDKSKDKGRFARGEALLQDLSDPAKTVLGSKVPNSGTADRMWATAGLGGAIALDPVLTGGAVLGGSLLYSSPAQALLRGLVSARPQAAQEVGSLLANTSPMLGPAGGLLALEARK